MARARDTERGEPGAHHGLVLGVDQRVGPGSHRHAVGDQRAQVLGGDVLVVEGDDAAAGGDAAQGLEVAVVADDVVGDHLRGRDALGLGQQPQRQPERGGGLGHHPGQLAAADDGEDGGALGHAEP